MMIERIRRALTRGHEAFPELPEVRLRPIGVVRNGVKDTNALAEIDVESLKSRIVLRPEYEEALLGLHAWSHLIVLFWPHLVPEEVRGSKLRLHPRDDPENPLQGVLATRAQIRMNPILCTAVRVLGIKGTVIRVQGLDAIDGTPVLDVKPYIPRFDSVPEAVMPEWVTRGAEMGKGK